MRKFFCLYTALLTFGSVSSQTLFDGTFESMQDNRKLITQMSNVNGNVTGISVFADGQGAKTAYTGTVSGSVLTGKLKDDLMGIEIKFEAVDDGNSIRLEMKGAFLELTYSKEERTITMTRSGSESAVANNSPANLDSRLFGTWIHREGNIYVGLRLTPSGKCQRSSMVSVDGVTSGSLDEWNGNSGWYVEGNKLYIVDDGYPVLEGSYTFTDEGMWLIKDNRKRFYSK